MSILSALIKDEHTFAAYAEKELVKLFNEAPKIEEIASPILTYVGAALQIIVGAEAGAPAAAIVGSVIKQAQSDLVAVSGLIYDFGATPSASSIVSGVQSDLGSLLTAGHITNATSVSNVTKVVDSLSALAKALPAAVPAAA